MTDTPNLGLPYIEAAQAQKHVTHNEALRMLDALVMLSVLDRDLSSPPPSPAEGDRYLVKSPGTDAFAGMDDRIAHFIDGGWTFHVPRAGWICYVQDEGALIGFDGAAWIATIDLFGGVTELQNLNRLGVGTAADATNLFSAKLNNALWTARAVGEGGDGNLRYKLNKESAAKTLSFLFQDDFSGRAEIGLTGDDDFHFKVSPDGSTWYEGVKIDRASDKVSFPVSGGPRQMLTADRTYYVRTDGSDGNDGLADTPGGAFLTIQKAIDVVLGTLDLGGYDVTIQVAAGTYTDDVLMDYAQVGKGKIILVGDTTTPSNVLISTTSLSHAIKAYAGVLYVKGFKITTAGNGSAIQSRYSGVCLIDGNMEFGNTVQAHLSAVFGGKLGINGANYTISGNGQAHYQASDGGILLLGNGCAFTATLSGTPSFATAFAMAKYGSYMQAQGITFSGDATGKRYNVEQNSVIRTDGGGAGYFPGDTAGTQATGGQYI